MVTVSELDKQLTEYQSQFDQLKAGLVQLETEFQTKREQGVATLNQLHGAVMALQILKSGCEPIEVEAKDVPTSIEDALQEALADVPGVPIV